MIKLGSRVGCRGRNSLVTDTYRSPLTPETRNQKPETFFVLLASSPKPTTAAEAPGIASTGTKAIAPTTASAAEAAFTRAAKPAGLALAEAAESVLALTARLLLPIGPRCIASSALPTAGAARLRGATERAGRTRLRTGGRRWRAAGVVLLPAVAGVLVHVTVRIGIIVVTDFGRAIGFSLTGGRVGVSCLASGRRSAGTGTGCGSGGFACAGIRIGHCGLSPCGCLTGFRIAHRAGLRGNIASLGTGGLHTGAVGISPRRCVVGFAALHVTGAAGGSVECTVIASLRLAGVGIVTSAALIAARGSCCVIGVGPAGLCAVAAAVIVVVSPAAGIGGVTPLAIDVAGHRAAAGNAIIRIVTRMIVDGVINRMIVRRGHRRSRDAHRKTEGHTHCRIVNWLRHDSIGNRDWVIHRPNPRLIGISGAKNDDAVGRNNCAHVARCISDIDH